MKKICALLVVLGLCAIVLLSSPPRTQGKNDKLRKNAIKIENSYIVVLDDQWVGERGPNSIAPYIAREMASNYRGKLNHIYQNAVNGFAVEMSPEDAEALSLDYRVKVVEEDGVVTADTRQ